MIRYLFNFYVFVGNKFDLSAQDLCELFTNGAMLNWFCKRYVSDRNAYHIGTDFSSESFICVIVREWARNNVIYVENRHHEETWCW